MCPPSSITRIERNSVGHGQLRGTSRLSIQSSVITLSNITQCWIKHNNDKIQEVDQIILLSVIFRNMRANVSRVLFWLGCHDDVIKWKHFLRHWAFVWGIHRSPVNSSHKSQWRAAFIFSLICTWIKGWVSNRDAGDLRRHRAHYDVTVMYHRLLVSSYAVYTHVMLIYSRYAHLLTLSIMMPSVFHCGLILNYWQIVS